MTSSPKSITRTTTVVNNKTGVTTSRSVTRSGNQTTITKTTTIGKAKSVSSPKGAAPKGKSPSTPSKAAALALGEKWLLGPNDTRDLCGPVALANALRAATGQEASNAAIERLYRAAGGLGDSGAPVPVLLAAAATSGFAGCRLAAWREVSLLATADLVLMDLPHDLGVHAAAITGGSAVMWGAEIPLDDLAVEFIGAWSLTWHGQETSCRSST